MEETLRELEGVDHDKHRIELGELFLFCFVLHIYTLPRYIILSDTLLTIKTHTHIRMYIYIYIYIYK